MLYIISKSLYTTVQCVHHICQQCSAIYNNVIHCTVLECFIPMTTKVNIFHCCALLLYNIVCNCTTTHNVLNLCKILQIKSMYIAYIFGQHHIMFKSLYIVNGLQQCTTMKINVQLCTTFMTLKNNVYLPLNYIVYFAHFCTMLYIVM